MVAYHGDNNKLRDKVQLTSGSFQNVELFFFTQGRVKLLLFITLEEICNSGSEEFVKF